MLKFKYLVLCVYIAFISSQSFGDTSFDFKERDNFSVLLGKPEKSVNLTWAQLSRALIEYNRNAPAEKKIKFYNYRELYDRIPGAPPNPRKIYPYFKERGGFPALLGKITLTWEQLNRALIEYNKEAPEDEKINSTTYSEFYNRIPGAPLDPHKAYPDFKIRGRWPALLGEVLLTWEQLNQGIIEYNKEAPKGEKISSYTYSRFYSRIPGAPPDPRIAYSDFKERGSWPTLLGKICLKAFSS